MPAKRLLVLLAVAYAIMAVAVTWVAHRAIFQASLHLGAEINSLALQLDRVSPEARHYVAAVEDYLADPVPQGLEDIRMRSQLIAVRVATNLHHLSDAPLPAVVAARTAAHLEHYLGYVQAIALHLDAPTPLPGAVVARVRQEMEHLHTAAASTFTEGVTATQNALAAQKRKIIFFNRLLTSLVGLSVLGLGVMLVLIVRLLTHRHTLRQAVAARTADLAKERELLNGILSTSVSAVVVLDERDRIVFANPAAVDILGLIEPVAGAEEYQRPAWRITDLAGNPFPADAMPGARVRATGASVTNLRHAIEWPDGTRCVLSINAAPLQASDGAGARVVCSISDITNALAAEQTRRHTETYLRAVLDTAADGIITIGIHGVVEDFNPAAEAIFGYARDDVVGRNVSMLMPEPDSSAHDMYLRRYMETSRAAIIGVGREVTGRRRDGSLFPMFLAVNRAELEGRVFFTGIVRDITARKANEASMLQAKQEAELANRSKSEFLANMSHELRTPLNAILGFSEIMQSELFGPLGNSTYNGYMTNIHESGVHLLQVINDILDISKIEAGGMEIDDADVDVAAVLRASIRLVEPRATKTDISINLHMPPEALHLRADQRRVKQMVLNLLSNAVKFTLPGGSVTVEARQSDCGEVELAVRDTGIGMSSADIEKALRPFEQVDGGLNRTFEGTGLGLPIVLAMAQLHGGRLEIDSTPGAGTTATIVFPARRCAPAATAELTADI